MGAEKMIGEKPVVSEQYIGQVDRDITLIGNSITDTISFYFEKTQSGTDKFFWELMDKRRMEFIFRRALESPALSGQKRQQIQTWFVNNR